MKRIKQLRDLSVDHHHGLVLARRARKAAESNDKSIISETWNEVKEKFEFELEPHFQIEEEYIAPILARKGITDELDRFYREHKKLRSLVGNGAKRNVNNLLQFSELLKSHIRFEEEEFFELTQQLLDSNELALIEEASKKG